jgi:hypothetical protein
MVQKISGKLIQFSSRGAKKQRNPGAANRKIFLLTKKFPGDKLVQNNVEL